MAQLELILARNLVGQLSTPSFLVDAEGRLVYYNEAAGGMLGTPYQEAGPMGPQEWGADFEPFDESGRRLPLDELPLTVAYRSGRPAHSRFQIHSADGKIRHIDVTAFPIVGRTGRQGALAIFWPADEA